MAKHKHWNILQSHLTSRISIKESSVAKLGSVCRRVYRIFSHAYFHHRNLFDEFEVFICVNIKKNSLMKYFLVTFTEWNLFMSALYRIRNQVQFDVQGDFDCSNHGNWWCRSHNHNLEFGASNRIRSLKMEQRCLSINLS